jgi:hypothetical protein
VRRSVFMTSCMFMLSLFQIRSHLANPQRDSVLNVARLAYWRKLKVDRHVNADIPNIGSGANEGSQGADLAALAFMFRQPSPKPPSKPLKRII